MPVDASSFIGERLRDQRALPHFSLERRSLSTIPLVWPIEGTSSESLASRTSCSLLGSPPVMLSGARNGRLPAGNPEPEPRRRNVQAIKSLAEPCNFVEIHMEDHLWGEMRQGEGLAVILSAQSTRLFASRCCQAAGGGGATGCSVASLAARSVSRQIVTASRSDATQWSAPTARWRSLSKIG